MDGQIREFHSETIHGPGAIRHQRARDEGRPKFNLKSGQEGDHADAYNGEQADRDDAVAAERRQVDSRPVSPHTDSETGSRIDVSA